MYFISDDEYIYHIDKIMKNNGKFIIQKNYHKYGYVHANKKCNIALNNTIKYIDKISHYGIDTHQQICQAIEQTKDLEGCYVEIGVYKGGSALTALNYMKIANINRKTYLLDTFDGFDYDEALNSAETHWTKHNNHHKLFGRENKKKYVSNVLSIGCPDMHYELIESNICKDQLPSEIEKIAVANIDVDLQKISSICFLFYSNIQKMAHPYICLRYIYYFL